MRLAPSVIRRTVSAVCAAAAIAAACACSMPMPSDAEIGCAFDAQSSPACVGYDAGAHTSTDASPSAAPSDGGDAGKTAGDGGTGLGESCTGPADCSGLTADYCLVSPNGGFKSFCTLTHCTATECGANYKCCDCTKSSVSLVNGFPPGICVLPMTAMALPAFGCTCD
jgi:hypothetical protein